MKPPRKVKNFELHRLEQHGQPGLVSVILPTYNRDYCVTKSIDSALTQTYRDLEVIVIDDGSTDSTRDVIARKYANEPRVKYVWQSNGRVAVARNHGIRLARGEFMALLDSDDIWKPWKIELQVKVLQERPEVGMVWTDMEGVDPHGQVIAEKYLRRMYAAYRWFPDEQTLFTLCTDLPTLTYEGSEVPLKSKLCVGDIFSAMMMGNLVHTSTVLMRRDRLARVGYFPEYMKNGGEDYDFHLRTCRVGPVAYLDVSSIYYRVGWHDQITEQNWDFFYASQYLKTIRRYLQSDNGRIHLSKAMMQIMMAQAYGWIGGALFERGRRKSARKFLAESLRYQIHQPRTMMILARSALPNWLDALALKAYRLAKGLIESTSVSRLTERTSSVQSNRLDK